MFGPLRFRDYRLFLSGSFIANLGLWVQQIALGWLVYDMTQSTSLLGTVSFCGNLPVLTIGLLGGAIADRASRRTIMLGTLAMIALAAFALSALTAGGVIAVWHVIGLSMVVGTANALYGPAMQAVLPSLVAETELLGAISLNAVQFNLARTVGPAFAGVAYGAIGPAGCFALNGAAFVIMVLMLARVRLPHRPAGAGPPLLRALREGVSWVRRHPTVGPALMLAAVLSIFGFPYLVLLPAVARDVLGLEAAGLGWLMAAVGAGAVTGGLGLAATRDAFAKERLAVGCAVVFGLALAAMVLVRGAHAMAVLLFVMGFLQTASIASLNTAIQVIVPEGMRGRVMSMMTVILFGFATTGALLVGVIGDRVGVVQALSAGGVVVAAVATRELLRGRRAARAVLLAR